MSLKLTKLTLERKANTAELSTHVPQKTKVVNDQNSLLRKFLEPFRASWGYLKIISFTGWFASSSCSHQCLRHTKELLHNRPRTLAGAVRQLLALRLSKGCLKRTLFKVSNASRYQPGATQGVPKEHPLKLGHHFIEAPRSWLVYNYLACL